MSETHQAGRAAFDLDFEKNMQDPEFRAAYKRARTEVRESSHTVFEARLVEDEDLRIQLAKLQEAGRRVQDASADLDEARQHYRRLIRDLAETGAPKALLARLVGLSPQRINSICKEPHE